MLRWYGLGPILERQSKIRHRTLAFVQKFDVPRVGLAALWRYETVSAFVEFHRHVDKGPKLAPNVRDGKRENMLRAILFR